MLSIQAEREEDGRWLAEVPDIHGAMVYDQTEQEAIAHAEALALRALAKRLEHREDVPDLHGLFAA